MGPLYTMVDDATPPAASELPTLRAVGVTAMLVYVGGVNNGGREWTPSDAAAVRSAGILTGAIYVGENVCDGCRTPINLTATQGSIDGRAAVADAKAFGMTRGPVALDLEQATTDAFPGDWPIYARPWTHAVSTAGYTPVLYLGQKAAASYSPDVPTGLWLALWNGRADLNDIPHIERWHGCAHQYSDNWHGFDASVMDGAWFDMPNTENGTSQAFPNGFSIGGGMYQYWKHNGGIIAFGMPISHEYVVGSGPKAITRQWFERAILERVAGQWPSEWDVTGVRLGSMLQANTADIARYQNDVKLYPQAFITSVK